MLPILPISRRPRKMFLTFIPKALLQMSLLLFTFGLGTASASAQAEAKATITILDATPSSVTVELRVEDVQVESLEQQGTTFQRLTIPNTELAAEPGAPLLPSAGVMVGIPSSQSKPDIEVLESEHELLQDLLIYPAPQIQVAAADWNTLENAREEVAFYLDKSVYEQDHFLPGDVATVGATAEMRDQAVVPLRFNPVQYNPVTREAKLYRRIVVRVSWAEVAAAAAPLPATSPYFESLLSASLANYDALERPKTKVSSNLAVQAPGESEATDAASTLKIGVDADGVYRITYADLTSAGFVPATVDPRKLQMTVHGAEIPIIVSGEEDGVFDPDDYILFYGVKNRDIYTTRTIYWLTAGATAGLRMSTVDGTPTGATIAESFPWSEHAEVDYAYWGSMPDGEGQDHYFWGDAATGSVIGPNIQGVPAAKEFTVRLNSIGATSSTAKLRVQLKGYTALTHRTRVYLNDILVADKSWSGQTLFTPEIEVAHTLLRDGDNVVKLESVDTGAEVDGILVNWFEFDYQSRYVTDSGLLRYAAPRAGTFAFELTQLPTDDVLILDVTNPAAPRQIVNAEVIAAVSTYKARYQATVAADAVHLVTDNERLLSPDSFQLDQASSWGTPQNGADYLIITHGDFYSEALRLSNHRAAQGLRTAVVDVEDLYDEFNEGIFNPEAIREFLKYAYENWQAPAPAAVLFFGDAYLNYRDTTNNGTKNYVPTQVIEGPWGHTASDNWFVAFVGDDVLPDMAAGRFSVETPAEAKAVVDKTIAYDAQAATSDWNTHHLLVADDDISQFEQIANAFAEKVPYYYIARRVFAGQYPASGTDTPAGGVMDALNRGAVITSYTGHGDVEHWGQWNGDFILALEDIAALSNQNRLSFVLVGNCSNGNFAVQKSITSLAEQFQRVPAKGAIGTFAPATLGFTSGHEALIGEVYDAVFQDDLIRLGEATSKAKLEAFAISPVWLFLVETYILFGDPMTELVTPPNFPYVVETTPTDGEDGFDSSQPIQVIFSKPVDPTKVQLRGDLEGLNPQMFWNQEYSAVTFFHDVLQSGVQYQVSVEAKDNAGRPLGDGLVPSTWSFVVAEESLPIYLPVIHR